MPSCFLTSRTGFVIRFGGCPIHWVSKLQSEIALSTCESELMALSKCMRQLIPLRAILSNISKIFKLPNVDGLLTSEQTHAYTKSHQSTVYEDNKACLELIMNADQYHPRTKHAGIKWFHFKDQIANGSIRVAKTHTDENQSDLLTKPLPRTKFEYLRRLLMGR